MDVQDGDDPFDEYCLPQHESAARHVMSMEMASVTAEQPGTMRSRESTLKILQATREQDVTRDHISDPV